MPALSGKWILVTRPTHQAEALCRLIEQAGGIAIRFPTLQINAVEIPQSRLHSLNRFHIAIFTSANAVECSIPCIENQKAWPSHWRVAAIGAATAAKLRSLQHSVDIVPDKHFNSEALLAHSALQNVQGLHILIIRGLGGRELLADKLRGRGAQIEYLEVYRRSKPTTPKNELINALKKRQLSFITANSPETLQNLIDLLDPIWQKPLLNTPIIVVSQKMVAQAISLGFNARVFLSANASDQSIMETLIRTCG